MMPSFRNFVQKRELSEFVFLRIELQQTPHQTFSTQGEEHCILPGLLTSVTSAGYLLGSEEPSKNLLHKYICDTTSSGRPAAVLINLLTNRTLVILVTSAMNTTLSHEYTYLGHEYLTCHDCLTFHFPFFLPL